MGNPLNWNRAKQASKPHVRVLDETEYRDKDAAARWLKTHDPRELNRKAARRRQKQSERKRAGVKIHEVA